jgi:hypothetical protein
MSNLYEQHQVRGAIPGTTMNIAKARRFILRTEMPKEIKVRLIAQAEWMLREHAEAAHDVLEIEEAVKSGKSHTFLTNLKYFETS